MKVFISWSGKRSKHIAMALRDWLPNVLQSVRPFISSQDIAKGTRGNVQITKELETASIGIICLTPENQAAPWILFEAGALSKLTSAYVCTYLYDLEPSEIAPPIGQFQHTKSTEEDTFALVQTINAGLPDDVGLTTERLRSAFEVWWVKLSAELETVPKKPKDEKVAPDRTEQDKIDEMLQLVRKMSATKSQGVFLRHQYKADSHSDESPLAWVFEIANKGLGHAEKAAVSSKLRALSGVDIISDSGNDVWSINVRGSSKYIIDRRASQVKNILDENEIAFTTFQIPNLF